MVSPDKKGIALQLAPEPERTLEERLVMDETLDATMRRVQARMRNMVIEMADERSERIQRGMESIKAIELDRIITADLACDPEKWGENASGTMAFLDRHLGIHPIISREKLAGIDLTSSTLVQDVLQLADGAHQDIGFFVKEKTDDGERQVGFDELDLRALQASA